MNKQAGCVFFAGLIAASNALASGTVGNGGKGVLCPQPDGSKKLIAMDYIRAQYDWSLEVQYADGTDETKKAINLVGRIAKLDPTRAASYAIRLKHFFNDVLWSDTALPETGDSHEVLLCDGGTTVQVVNQPGGDTPWERLADGKVYVIDQRLWNIADFDQRAALMVHEVILREHLLGGIATTPDSDPAMWFNALIAARKTDAYADSDYLTLLKQIQFPVFSHDGFIPSMLAEGTLKGGAFKVSLVFDFNSFPRVPVVFRGTNATADFPSFGILSVDSGFLSAGDGLMPGDYVELTFLAQDGSVILESTQKVTASK